MAPTYEEEAGVTVVRTATVIADTSNAAMEDVPEKVLSKKWNNIKISMGCGKDESCQISQKLA